MKPDDWREEAESHLSMREEWLRERGRSAEEARREARKSFGNRGRVDEQVRAVHIPAWLDALRQDLNYAWRGLRRSPVFASSAVAAIAIGIGAATAVFSVVDRTLFRPLPFPNEERMTWLWLNAPLVDKAPLLDRDLATIREGQDVFTAMTSARGTFSCAGDGTEPMRCGQVEANFLAVFGLRPAFGADFEPVEDRPGSPPVALISQELWHARFGGRAGIVGQSMEIDGEIVRVKGVLPKGFQLPGVPDADLLMPQRMDTAQNMARGVMFPMQVFGRLKPGLTPQDAEQRLRPVFQKAMDRLRGSEWKGAHFRVGSVRERLTQNFRLSAWLLLGAVLMVLAIAVANVANLQLARAANRNREMSIRAAMGAGRERLLRQTLTESMLLGLAGGVTGVGLGYLLLRGFAVVAPVGTIELERASLDARVLLGALVATLLSAVLFGLAPALQRHDGNALTGSRVTTSRRGLLRQALVVTQLALATVLLAGAGVLMASLWRLSSVPLGMRTESIVTLRMTTPTARYGAGARQIEYFRQVEERLRRLPGVLGVAQVDAMPPSDRYMMMPLASFELEGRQKLHAAGEAVMRQVTPGYFSLLEIPVRQGRVFTESERGMADEFVVLSETMAVKLGGNVTGARLRFGTGGWRTVLGVVGDVRNAGLTGDNAAEYYELARFHPANARSYQWTLLRVHGGSDSVARAAREEVRAIDQRIAVSVSSVETLLWRMTSRARFQAFLLGGFALAGLLLAAIGLYGVIAFLAAQRTAEIGIRMTLGATASQIRGMLVSQAGRWMAVGLCIGLAGVAVVSRLIETLLFQTGPAEPAIVFGALSVLIIVGLLAAWLPGARAARIDPVKALRYE